MKKLLVLLLLGLGLGAGTWKAQNPEGTMDDFRTQAISFGERLKTGALAIRDASPTSLQAAADEQQARQANLEERLVLLEQGLADSAEAAAKADAASAAATTDAANAAENASALENDELTGQIAALDSNLQEALAGNDANTIRLDAIDSRLELLVRRLDEQTLDDELQGLQESLKSLGTEVTELRDSTDARQAELVNELATAAEQTSALKLRLDTLAASQTATLDADATDPTGEEPTSDNVDGNPVNRTALATLSAGLDERFSNLEERLSTVNSDSRRLALLNEQLEATKEQLAGLQEQIATNRQDVNQLSGTVTELETAGKSLSIDTVQAEIRDQLALVQSQFESESATGNTDALEALLDSTRGQITELEERVQDLPAASTEATNAQEIQAALESQIVALEKRLEEINTADPELANTLSNVQEKVDELAAKSFVTQEDLQARNEPRAVQYKIYFDRNSAEITDGARVVLDSFIAQEKNRTTGVSIFGFTDRAGSAIYNQQLALQRATNVRSYLIQNGLDYTKIKALSGLGEDAAAAVLPDNADDAQQRVVVLYAAQQ